VLQRVLPIDHVFVELRAVAFFARVLELVERRVLGVQQGSVLRQEVVVDQLLHNRSSYYRPDLCEPVRTPYPRHLLLA